MNSRLNSAFGKKSKIDLSLKFCNDFDMGQRHDLCIHVGSRNDFT